MSTKIEHAIFQITQHPYSFQKYKGLLNKEVDNLKQITRYKVITIEGFEPETESFKILKDVIETDLNLTDKKEK